MAVTIQHLRGTAAKWANLNPILKPGELGFEKDTKVMKIGDGVTPWNDLDNGYLRKAGGTMTGALSLVAPTSDAHAARKTDVDVVRTALDSRLLGYSSRLTQFDVTTTEGTVLNVTFMPPSVPRMLMIYAHAKIINTGTVTVRGRILRDGSTEIGRWSEFSLPSGEHLLVSAAIRYLETNSGELTYNMMIQRLTGTATVSTRGHETPTTFSVVDMGPAEP